MPGFENNGRIQGEEIEFCTIIVTDANEVLRPIHDRMPVILDAEEYDVWLDVENRDVGCLRSMLKPYPAEMMEFWPVSKRAGNPVNDDPTLIQPLK